MNIGIIGTGYVGLVSGVCFAEMGVHVVCIDINKEKIDGLNNGIIPVYEPGLDEMVRKNICRGRLRFTTNLQEVLDSLEMLFIAVGTPRGENGSADLKYVLQVAKTIGKNIKRYILVVTKSTVPVGTSELVRKRIAAELEKRGENIQFDVASNPEFLKEGSAIKDFMNPDRVIVGTETKRAEELMSHLYKPFLLNNFPIIFMDIKAAEMTKYAANSMLATRISFMNELANLCDSLGIDISLVRKGIASDPRIGNRFLYPGCGYGGSCLPKDVKALIHTGETNGHSMELLKAVERVNEDQKKILFNKLSSHFRGELKGKTIAVWGLSFKPETDDIREAPSIILINQLYAAGCRIKAFDPVAAEEFGKQIIADIEYSPDMYAAAEGADAIVLVTEWKEFRLPDWQLIRSRMKYPLVVDGRNIYTDHELENLGFKYLKI